MSGKLSAAAAAALNPFYTRVSKCAIELLTTPKTKEPKNSESILDFLDVPSSEDC